MQRSGLNKVLPTGRSQIEIPGVDVSLLQAQDPGKFGQDPGSRAVPGARGRPRLKYLGRRSDQVSSNAEAQRRPR